MTPRMTSEDKERWIISLNGFRGASERLAEAFLERWQQNRLMTAPVGLPQMSNVSDEYGWACALELFLLSFEVSDSNTRLIFESVAQAESRLSDELRGEAWLEDLLALRRLPPPQQPRRWERRTEDVDLEAAELILNAIGKISSEIPNPSRRDYQFFGRRYDALTNVLVGEIVEGHREGAIWLACQSGARILPPDARTLFADLVLLTRRITDHFRHRGHEPTDSVEALSKAVAVLRKWHCEIANLVDSISILNEGLELLAEHAGNFSHGEHDALCDAHHSAYARRFDDAFYRLLLADEPGRATESGANVDTLLVAMQALFAADDELPISVDRVTVQAELRGVFATPVCNDNIIETADGTIAIDEETAALCGAL